MKTLMHVLATVALACAVASGASAQLQIPTGHYLLPANPTSADNLILSLDGGCGAYYTYRANSYVVSMAQNNITVTMGERGPICGLLDSPRREIDLGRLPAGNYTVSVIDAVRELGPVPPLFTNFPFTVADARASKSAPYVRLDYSGHWWDPNDSGWGLFIWQDARAPTDSMLAAWFTYTSDGKPMWYVFQPTWFTTTITNDAKLMQTSRLPGPTSPPPNPTAINFVGTASLNFLNYGIGEEGTLTYTFNGGAKQTRAIKRFRP